MHCWSGGLLRRPKGPWKLPIKGVNQCEWVDPKLIKTSVHSHNQSRFICISIRVSNSDNHMAYLYMYIARTYYYFSSM